MHDDQQLLRKYAMESCEDAFGELVAHHVNLVYSAALRQTNGDAHLAKDVAQLVFTDLARKAGSIPRNIVVAGWLHRATRYAAGQLRRTEHRRRMREYEAATLNAIPTEPMPSEWEQIRPMLDEALDRLNRDDRHALVLRYFEERSLAEIGTAMGSSEEAARKRVSRALEKLRDFFGKRGVTTTTAVLTNVISANAVQIAPAGLAAALTNASLAGAGTGTGTLALLKIMAMTKLQAGLSAIVVASLATALVIQHQAARTLRDQDESLRQQSAQLAQLAADNESLSNLVAQAKDPGGNDLRDLLRLRGEVGMLLTQTNDLGKLRAVNSRLQARKSRHDQAETSLQLQDEGYAKMGYAKDWLYAFSRYAATHDRQFPADFAQAFSLLPAQSKEESGATSDQYEIIYHGAMPTNGTIKSVIVLREKQAWESAYGQWAKTYAFADGHCEIHVEADGNFDAFEAQHSAAPPLP